VLLESLLPLPAQGMALPPPLLVAAGPLP